MMVLTHLTADAHDSDQNNLKTKAKFPSGLVSNWQSKLSVPTQTSSKAKAPEPKAAALGGLNDEDAAATFSPLKLKGTGRNRKNEVRCYQ
jgi:hypothetical protein